MSVGTCSSRRRRRSHLDWLAICSIRSVGHSGPASSWSCSSRSSRRPSAVNSRGRSTPMRQLSARRQEPEATKHRPIDSRSSDRPTAERVLGRIGSEGRGVAKVPYLGSRDQLIPVSSTSSMELPDDLDARLRHEAERRGLTISELTREAIETHLGGRGRRLDAAGTGRSGRSGRSDISERIERSSAARCRHRAPDRRRPPVRVRRRRRPPPRGEPRPAPRRSRTAGGSGPRDHGGRLPDRHEARRRTRGALPGRPRGRRVRRRAPRTADWLRIAQLVWRYRDLPLGTVDASVVAASEWLGEHRLATLDRRHFGVVRPMHADAFELLP